MSYKKCDWIGCSEIGFFEGLDKTRLNDEGKRHIFDFLRFIFLCPRHFELGVGTLDEKNPAPK
jgi:hypothetical protein